MQERLGFVAGAPNCLLKYFLIFDLLFYASSLSQNSSLEHLVSHLDSFHHIELCKQSLDERFTEKTVNFVKAVLYRLIRAQFSDMLISDAFMPDFHQVRIKDSTKFKVPPNLADSYSGNGGGVAGIAIQYEYDLKTGKFLDLTITEASRNDQTDASETVENICENDLILRDMGYFSTAVFRKIEEQRACYLSRLPASTTVYLENGIKLDFQKLERLMTDNKIEKLEMQVFIGENKLPVRLMIGLVPPAVYQERVRRKEAEKKEKGVKRRKKQRYFSILIFTLPMQTNQNYRLIKSCRCTGFAGKWSWRFMESISICKVS